MFKFSSHFVKTRVCGAKRKNIMSKTKPKKTRRKKLGAAKREIVIDAAVRAMNAKGLDGIHARTLAARAGISVGSMYNLFSDLDELTRIVNAQTYDELYAEVAEALEIARKDRETPRDQMLALAECYLNYVESHQTRWLAVLAFNRSRTEPPPKWYLEKEISLFKIIEDALEAFPGANDNKARQNYARALWASVHGIVTIAVADGFLMQPIENVREQIEIIVHAVAASIE